MDLDVQNRAEQVQLKQGTAEHVSEAWPSTARAQRMHGIQHHAGSQ